MRIISKQKVDRTDGALGWTLRITGFTRVLGGIFFFALLHNPVQALGAWYVDNMAAGSHNGTSWVNAWSSLSQIRGVGAGDTVYISGGPSGSTRTYATPTSAWQPAGGTASNPITYQIGQDTNHNGIAIFDGNLSSQSTWIYVCSSTPGITISGDAGDGQQHFWVTNWVALGSCNGAKVFTLSYINFCKSDGQLDFSPGDGIQIDHCYAYVATTAADHFSYLDANNSSTNLWGRNKAFCNTIYVPHAPGSGGGDGADCFQWNSTSVDIYSNLVVGYTTNYTGSQHQDGMQPLGGSYWRVHDNVFVDIANYPLYGDGYYGSFNYCQMYNNIACFSDASLEGTGPPQAGGWGIANEYLESLPVCLTNCVVCNNLAVDYVGHTTWAFYVGPSSFIVKNCWIANNLNVNSGGLGPVAGGIFSADNLNITASQATNYFVHYTAFGGIKNDFHLTTNATSLIGHGTNLSQGFPSGFVSVDKDGQARSSTGNWDIGPYQYTNNGVATNFPPTVSAIIASAPDMGTNTVGLQVYEGTTVRLSASASVPNGDALTWQWLYSLNGGTQTVYQSGSGTVSTNSFTYPIGTAGNSYVWTLQVTDSQTKLSAQSQLTLDVELEPPQGLRITFN